MSYENLDLDFEDELSNYKDSMSFKTHFLETAGADIFQDRFSLVYGGSNSGKTTIVQYIINTIKEQVPNFIVVTPETSRKFYDKFVPATSIWESLSEQDINNIVDRQEDATKIKSVTQRIEVLHMIHTIVAPSQAEKFLIELSNRGLDEDSMVELLRLRLGSGNNEIQEKIKRVLLQKMISMEKSGSVEKSMQIIGLNPDNFGTFNYSVYRSLNILEKSFKENAPLEILKIVYNAYCYMDLNQRLCLIIDDMTPDLKKITNYSVLDKNPFSEKKKPQRASDKKNIFLEIATRCRHVGLSVIIITHVFNEIEKKVRSNFNVCLFTNQEAFDTAMPEISQEDAVASKQQTIARSVYTRKDNDGNAFTKLIYAKLDTGVTDDNQSMKLKMIKADGGDIGSITTTKCIDNLITKHGDTTGSSYSF